MGVLDGCSEKQKEQINSQIGGIEGYTLEELYSMLQC